MHSLNVPTKCQQQQKKNNNFFFLPWKFSLELYNVNKSAHCDLWTFEGYKFIATYSIYYCLTEFVKLWCNCNCDFKTLQLKSWRREWSDEMRSKETVITHSGGLLPHSCCVRGSFVIRLLRFHRNGPWKSVIYNEVAQTNSNDNKNLIRDRINQR